jgi:Recombinase zinc beta ribbon domain
MNLIHNRIYLGELSYGKDRRYVNPRAVEPIVDLDIWTAAQHPNGHGLKPVQSGNYLLTGLLRCSACGYSMNGTSSSHSTRIYRCPRKHSGRDCPRPARVNADLIEPIVECAYFEIFDDLRVVIPGKESDLSELEANFDKANRRLTQAMSPEVQDAGGEGWPAMIRERRKERDEAAAALGEAKATQRRPELPTNLNAIWHTMKTEDKRDLLAVLFDTLAVRRDDAGLTLIAFMKGDGPEGLSRRGSARHRDFTQSKRASGHGLSPSRPTPEGMTRWQR